MTDTVFVTFETPPPTLPAAVPPPPPVEPPPPPGTPTNTVYVIPAAAEAAAVAEAPVVVVPPPPVVLAGVGTQPPIYDPITIFSHVGPGADNGWQGYGFRLVLFAAALSGIGPGPCIIRITFQTGTPSANGQINVAYIGTGDPSPPYFFAGDQVPFTWNGQASQALAGTSAAYVSDWVPFPTFNPGSNLVIAIDFSGAQVSTNADYSFANGAVYYRSGTGHASETSPTGDFTLEATAVEGVVKIEVAQPFSTAATPPAGDSSNNVATTQFVAGAAGTSAAALASAVTTIDAAIAAVVAAEVAPATASPLMDGVAAAGSATPYARADHVHPTDTSLLPAPDPFVGAMDIEWFGDGSDGNVTISSGVTVLTRDTYYNNLTLSGTGQLMSGGFRIFVAGVLDITAAPANAIIGGNQSGAGGASTAASTPGAGGNNFSGTAYGSFDQSANAGSAGGTGTAAATTIAYGFGGQGGIGGGSTNAANVTNRITPRHISLSLLPFTPFISTGLASMGEGAGGVGGTGNGTSGDGGGGGAGGPAVGVFARTINRGGSTAAGAINANGGVGGAGFTGTIVGGPSPHSSGGGGGGGGFLMVVARYLTGSTATNALSASGGTGGQAGGQTTAIGGQGGGAGTLVFGVLDTNAITVASATTAGSAGSTGNLAAGGAGAALQVNL